jgi:hypothetical protein
MLFFLSRIHRQRQHAAAAARSGLIPINVTQS